MIITLEKNPQICKLKSRVPGLGDWLLFLPYWYMCTKCEASPVVFYRSDAKGSSGTIRHS